MSSKTKLKTSAKPLGNHSLEDSPGGKNLGADDSCHSSNNIVQALTQESKNTVTGFFSFLKQYNIVALAVGLVLAQTSKGVVDALVTDLITPVIALLTKNVRFEDYVVVVGEAEFLVGHFVTEVLQMVIIMAVVYVVVGKILKQEKVLIKKKRKG